MGNQQISILKSVDFCAKIDSIIYNFYICF